MMKSGLEKIFLKFLNAEAIFFQFILLISFDENHKFINRISNFPHGEKSEIPFFLPYVLDLIHLLKQKFCQDSNLRVKKCLNQSSKMC